MMTVTVDGLRKVIENGKRLKCIQLGKVNDLHIDETATETLLDAIEINRGLFIQFGGCQHNTSFVLSNDHKKPNIYTFKPSDQRLEIRYEECKRWCC